MLLPFNLNQSQHSETQYCLSVRRQRVVWRDNERHHPFELKNEQKTKLFIHLFDVSKVICSIIQQLKGCIVWLSTVLDLKFVK